ncbi:MAG TPA: PDZ domain-containing protein [Planctomycetaceae bacterium]|nr:PDZ domain-containing protein [Planctomycetaceae bacterium]
MKSLAAILGWLAFVPLLQAAPDARLEALEEQAFKEAAAVVAPSVVRIETVGGLDQITPGLAAGGTTTGLIVTKDGFVVSSAFHFAAKPTSILVTLADSRRFAARLIATDRQRMITLLKIDATGLPVPRVAPRDGFKVGQWTLALGRTFDTDSPSVSLGIVSAVNRVWGKAVQTDAKISPLNYGGPLVDVQGRVMGILAPLSPQSNGETAGVEWYDSGIGFAVPLGDTLAVLDRLKAGQDLLPGVFGVTFQERDSAGATPVLDRVRFASPAEKAGLKKGDRIVAADGRVVRFVAELRSILGRKYAGDEVAMTAKRGEQKLDVKLTLVDKIPPFEPAYLGILPQRRGEGAVARIVLPEGPAAQAGLKAKDTITAWNDEPVTSSAQLIERVSRQRPGESAAVTVQRDGQNEKLTVKLSGYPETVPDQVAADIASTDAPVPDAPKTGRITETLEGHDRQYWAYIPESYRKGQPAALMIFLHPGADSMEAAVLRAWKPECERRGIILVAPLCDKPAGWMPNDLEFVQDVVAKVREEYAVADSRIFVHSVGSAAPFATIYAFRNRAIVRGVALTGAVLRGQLPENDPDERLQFHLSGSLTDKQATAIKATADMVRKARYPLVYTTFSQVGEGYPPDATVEELARWADSLDRI